MMLKPRLPGYAPDHMVYITSGGKQLSNQSNKKQKLDFLLSHNLCSLNTQFSQ